MGGGPGGVVEGDLVGGGRCREGRDGCGGGLVGLK